jgi:hypothetical protein
MTNTRNRNLRKKEKRDREKRDRLNEERTRLEKEKESLELRKYVEDFYEKYQDNERLINGFSYLFSKK